VSTFIITTRNNLTITAHYDKNFSELYEGGLDINSELTINTDGGLMSRASPLGATAAAQIIETNK
jgi:acetyl-CoA acetyltransferase